MHIDPLVSEDKEKARLAAEHQTGFDLVASLVLQYYDWLSDKGGICPDELLALPLDPQQRKLLLGYMDDVLTNFGLTADFRRKRAGSSSA